MYRWWWLAVQWKFFLIVHMFYGGQIFRVVNIFPSSTKLGVYIPEFHWWFQYNVCDIARSCFSSGLVFDMYEMSIVLNVGNSISGSPCQVQFVRLLVFEIYMISYLEGWFVSCHCLLSSFKICFRLMFSLQLSRLIYVFPGSAYQIQGLLGNVA